MKKVKYQSGKIIGMGLAAVIFAGILFSFCAEAQVSVTREAAGNADSIYVAGNPDFYPIEYYNEDSGRYEGIIPEILSKISEKTGYQFTYVSAGKENKQSRLAKNGQVEMLTAYLEEDTEYLSDKAVIFSLSVEGERRDVCFAFTRIAPEDEIQAIKEAVNEITEEEITEITLNYVMENQREGVKPFFIWGMIALFILMGALASIFYIKFRRCRSKNKQDDMVDSETGIGNEKYFSHYFNAMITDKTRVLYFITYIAFDAAWLNKYYNEEEAENMLRYAADILSQNAADTDIAARIAKNDFAVAFQSPNRKEAEEKVKILLCLLNQYKEKFGKEHEIVFRAGVYQMKQSDRSLETALYNAKQGYYYAMQKNMPVVFCSEKILNQSKEVELLQKQAAAGVKKGEFKLYLQFIVDRNTKKIYGAEALSRWQHPDKGVLTPKYYIEMMEQAKTIDMLDFYMFEQTCAQLEAWRKNGFKDLHLSSNFTRFTISKKDFLEKIEKIASKYEIDRSKLIIEITDDSLENGKTEAFYNITECKKAGFVIALDDLGGGYTSFLNLYDYPIDYVKIDREILLNAKTEKGKVLMKGIIDLAHNMNMTVLCEGVETEEQNKITEEMGCDYIQGHYYSRVVPKEEAASFLKNYRFSAI